MLFSPLVERALRLAGRQHRTQLRKSSDVPYFTHLAGTAFILLRAGWNDERLIAAALLHDVIEDTPCELADLEAEFPAEVVEWVAFSTERKRNADGSKRSWEDRKREHLEVMRDAPREARALTLADKLHNLGTMVFDLELDGELWSRFGASPERLLWYYAEMIERAAGTDSQLQLLAGECRELLVQLEQSVA